jgi:hypothetical protein
MGALPSSADTRERKRWPFIPAIQFSASVFVLWIAFFMVGQALLSIPAEFHEFEAGFSLEDDAAPSDSDPSDEVSSTTPEIFEAPST